MTSTGLIMDSEDPRTTVTAEWSLPRDRDDFWMAMNGSRMHSVLWEVDQTCRTEYKHGNNPQVAEFAEKIRQLIRDEIDLDMVR
jgi:hypothetical protein